MAHEQKDLLLKDLCSRLPYDVFVNINDIKCVLQPHDISDLIKCDVDIKPYLFPLSSMTEEQEKELNKVYSDEADLIVEHLKSDISGNIHTHRFNHQLSLNWYLKNHFDINGLIPMGLAIDATKLNIYDTRI
jgi:hypothetical protein